MDRCVIIDKNTLPSVDVSSYKENNVFITEKAEDKLDGLIRETSSVNSPLYVILFISQDRLPAVDQFLKTKSGRMRNFYFRLIVFCPETGMEFLPYWKTQRVSSYRNTGISAKEFLFIVQNSFYVMEEYHLEKTQEYRYRQELIDIEEDQQELIAIGKALSSEKNHGKLLDLILRNARKITGADAGSIFLIEEDENNEKKLVFKHAQTYSLDISYKEFSMPLNTNSIAGYVAVTGKKLNYPDVYKLSEDDPVSFNSSFDRDNDYRTKSMLVVPMKNHLDQIIGVIQLINCKEWTGNIEEDSLSKAHTIRLETQEDFELKTVPFKTRYEILLEAIANQAAITIENNRMIRQIQEQFEEFVKASVTAIESRDPATKGHSFRVAKMCVEMAKAVNKEKEGFFRDITFSPLAIKEIEYAALLHDFGKVYIDGAIFQKANKLFPNDLKFLLLKFDYLYRSIELQYMEKEKDLRIEMVTKPELADVLSAFLAEKEQKLVCIRNIKEKVKVLNEPKVVTEDPEKAISDICVQIEECDCFDCEENPLVIFDEEEKNNLSIKKGSLNRKEREEIESHVIRSYSFVSKIPWPPEFRNIPEITQKHHEKLDGTGYPNKLKGKDAIPIQARMIVIADIFDALTASDRPYKKAVPLEKTMQILETEAAESKVDPDLVALIKKHKIYERV